MTPAFNGLRLTITSLVLISVFLCCDNFRGTCEKPPRPSIRVTLEIDSSSLVSEQTKSSAVEQTIGVLASRMRGLGIRHPVICTDSASRITLYVPLWKSGGSRAGIVFGSTGRLEFCLVRDSLTLARALEVIDHAQILIDQDISYRLRMHAFEKENYPNSEKSGGEPTSVPHPIPRLSGLLKPLYGGQGVRLSDVDEATAILSRQEITDALDHAGLDGSRFLWSHDTIFCAGEQHLQLHYVKSIPEMVGDAIADADAEIDPSAGGALVSLRFNENGTKQFSRITGANVNRFLAIVLDRVVYTAPRIIQQIKGGSAQITGHFTMPEARGLAAILRSGPLPARLRIVEEQTIGAP
jgi:protein-export membrane protein SecD